MLGDLMLGDINIDIGISCWGLGISCRCLLYHIIIVSEIVLSLSLQSLQSCATSFAVMCDKIFL